jgi:cyclohexanone monooxygenase
MFVSIEQHVDWITDCMTFLRTRGVRTIEAKPDAEESWVAHVNEVAHRTLYPRAASWYMGANVPGSRACSCPISAASESIAGAALRSRRRDIPASN